MPDTCDKATRLIAKTTLELAPSGNEESLEDIVVWEPSSLVNRKSDTSRTVGGVLFCWTIPPAQPSRENVTETVREGCVWLGIVREKDRVGVAEVDRLPVANGLSDRVSDAEPLLALDMVPRDRDVVLDRL